MSNKKLLLNFLLTLLFLTFWCLPITATIHYVSHSGNNIPPYLTWKDAADSIQSAINVCAPGDTILVANGTYYESLVINTPIWLIGLSADSTVIDGFGLYYKTIEALSDFSISNFKIIGPGTSFTKYAIYNPDYNVNVKNCRVETADICLNNGNTSGRIENVLISNCRTGIFIACDTCRPVITNSIIIMGGINSDEAIDIFDGGNPIITNNVLIGNFNCIDGVGITFLANTIKIKNNIVAGFEFDNIEGNLTDTAIIYNNISSYSSQRGITIDSKTDMRNNIISNNEVGVSGPTSTNSDYNLYWKNNTNITGGLAEHDIVADPMFVNDTIPVYGGSYDFHLQAYSPAIDAGNPNILDVDGSRSDIGVFGGPGGEMYTYQDLAPKPPANLTAVYDSGLVKLTWNKNTEADLFRYRVYRDTVPNFIYDTTKIIAVTADTFYYDDVPEKYLAGNYYYKITAIDSAYHQSAASEEVHINITGVPEGPPIVIEEYKLLHNYPNPFNPSTKIPYRLKEGGYIKLLIYDIKGELLKVLVNEYQNAGYYEVEFSPGEGEIERGKLDAPFETRYRGDIASGIYLYRIEVIGEGRIPRFVDMGKMIYVK